MSREPVLDIFFHSQSLLEKLDRDFPLRFKGLRTSVGELAHHGYGMRLTRKFRNSGVVRCVFSKGRDSFTFRIPAHAWDGHLPTFFAYLEASALSSRTTFGMTSAYMAGAQNLSAITEADLLSELEKRIDARPPRKKKLRPPNNVVDFNEILRRLHSEENIERKIS